MFLIYVLEHLSLLLAFATGAVYAYRDKSIHAIIIAFLGFLTVLVTLKAFGFPLWALRTFEGTGYLGVFTSALVVGSVILGFQCGKTKVGRWFTFVGLFLLVVPQTLFFGIILATNIMTGTGQYVSPMAGLFAIVRGGHATLLTGLVVLGFVFVYACKERMGLQLSRQKVE